MAKWLKAGRRSVLHGLLGTLAAFLAGGRLPVRSAQADGAAIGKVTKLRGAAFLQRAGARALLEVGAALQTDDLIITLADARAKLTFIDGSTVSLSEFSKLTLDQYAFDPNAAKRDAAMTLETGVLRAVVAKVQTGSRFEVATGTAVAGVRSTDLIVQSEGARTQVYVIEGAVDVADRGTSMRSLPSIAQEDRLILKPGRVARLDGGKPVAAAWDQGKLNDLISQTDL
jgi:hypothetical protein